MGRDLVHTCRLMSVHYYETSYVCSHISVILGAEEGHPAFVFFVCFFATGARRRKSRSISGSLDPILEEPLVSSGRKLLGERKIEPTSMRGASDDPSPVSIHGTVCTRYVCMSITSVWRVVVW